ncbi:DUF5713 family protein [Roseibium sp. SCP14]|uniref:DUF5713 family protein n=1 Tax=Roseibium sp. SCP14 TaxID=3141375 RepID=UPI003336389B
MNRHLAYQYLQPPYPTSNFLLKIRQSSTPSLLALMTTFSKSVIVAAIMMVTTSSFAGSSKLAERIEALNNSQLKTYSFLEVMYDDGYFPKPLVEQSEEILVTLCEQIETHKPKDLQQLYELTRAATARFNDLQVDFLAMGSEIETVARENIAMDFEAISRFYGFQADSEELIGNREW